MGPAGASQLASGSLPIAGLAPPSEEIEAGAAGDGTAAMAGEEPHASGSSREGVGLAAEASASAAASALKALTT